MNYFDITSFNLYYTNDNVIAYSKEVYWILLEIRLNVNGLTVKNMASLNNSNSRHNTTNPKLTQATYLKTHCIILQCMMDEYICSSSTVDILNSGKFRTLVLQSNAFGITYICDYTRSYMLIHWTKIQD